MVKFSDLRLEGPMTSNQSICHSTKIKDISDFRVGRSFSTYTSFVGMKFNVIYTYMFRDFQKDKLKYEDAYRNTPNYVFSFTALSD